MATLTEDGVDAVGWPIYLTIMRLCAATRLCATTRLCTTTDKKGKGGKTQGCNLAGPKAGRASQFGAHLTNLSSPQQAAI